MRHFLDTEFIEGFHKPWFGKRRHFIDLISIGIVAEDGREYYAVSTEFRAKDADDWVKENVIAKLPERHPVPIFNGGSPNAWEQRLRWKPNLQIMQELRQFFGYTYQWTDYGADFVPSDENIEIYAYYADYDWVLFCSLFGRMIDLPKGMPMYCRDLKQMVDEYITSNKIQLEDFKNHPNYPKEENEHSALDDARWTRDLYNFVVSQ